MTRDELEDLLHTMLSQHENNIVDRVEARIRRRAKGERRRRSPELVAQLAAEKCTPSDIAVARARAALARLR